ncbi:YebG family protein [Shewanella sp. NFH-SH190041]|uniref:YebG family protein n=1 Tax=Shewanella sp. NFH-SH190041 TaxID=2950245 RepID=UPI0021C4217B|nr:YebG family protein [Shewanella sp. NFH-SH190041]
MAVVVQYVVVREGVEKMTFTSKKEADAYDKMLDIADNLLPFIQQSDLDLAENQVEELAFYLANNKDELLSLLKGSGTQVKTGAEKKAKSATKSQSDAD